MTTDFEARAHALRDAYEQRAAAELAAADLLVPGSGQVSWRGSLVPTVAVVKGLPGPAESSGGAAVSGADGVAVSKALEKLGHDPTQLFFTLSRPLVEMTDAGPDRLRLQLEAVAAPLVVALDKEAAEDVARAFGVEVPRFGVAVRVCGRRLVACEGLERSLADPRAKSRVWSQLKVAAPEPPVY